MNLLITKSGMLYYGYDYSIWCMFCPDQNILTIKSWNSKYTLFTTKTMIISALHEYYIVDDTTNHIYLFKLDEISTFTLNLRMAAGPLLFKIP